MGKLVYAKETPRLTIKVINGETNELMFEVPNRTCLDIGDFLSDNYISEMIKNKKYDVDVNLVRVLVIGDFYKQ
jgi:uncharacterized FlaG/YvyC family protein